MYPAAFAQTGPGETMRINVKLQSPSGPQAAAPAPASSQVREEAMGVFEREGATVVDEIPEINVVTLEIPAARFAEIASLPEIAQVSEFVEPDTTMRIALVESRPGLSPPRSMGAAQLVPNDPDYSEQWGPACIGAEELWDLQLGDPGIIVAIVDTGVDLNHPDLAANIDAALGYDFVNGDIDPQDDHGHGTHVAGIVAMEINNNEGGAGLQQVTLMPVKCLNADGLGSASHCAAGIVHAAAKGAKVINCSWGDTGLSQTLEDAVNYAVAQGSLVVAAAGNGPVSTPFYPAAYADVIGVAALSSCHTRAFWSNFGLQNVDLAAPGDLIYSTWWDPLGSTYSWESGTSMAAPHVSGAAAAYFILNPSFTAADVASALFAEADDLGDAGLDAYYGYGRVDMFPWLDIQGLAVAPSPTAGATIVALTAVAQSPGPIGSYIAGAEWWEGADPGVGNGFPMYPDDGFFDGVSEAINADIDVSAWALSSHTLSARCRDDAGQWGTAETTVLSITAPPVPGIKVNGSDGPIDIPSGGSTSVTVSLDPGSLAGQRMDWWVKAVREPNLATFWYVYGSGWIKAATPVRASSRKLKAIPLFEIYNGTLPSGTWTLTFAIDQLDGVYQETYKDTATVNILP